MKKNEPADAGAPQDERLVLLIKKWERQADHERTFDAPLGGKAIARGIAGVLDNCAEELRELLPPAAHQERTEPLEIVQRLTEWLSKGGLFNPAEMAGANEDATRQLILDARTALGAPARAAEELNERLGGSHADALGKAQHGSQPPAARAAEWQPLTKENDEMPLSRSESTEIGDRPSAAATDAGDDDDCAGTIERCAQVADSMAVGPWGVPHDAITPNSLATMIARAIRDLKVSR